MARATVSMSRRRYVALAIVVVVVLVALVALVGTTASSTAFRREAFDTSWPDRFGRPDRSALPKQAVPPTRCGAGLAPCPEGACCSREGQCGMTLDDCAPNVNSPYNGPPSVWRCGRFDADRANSRRPACKRKDPPGGNIGCGPASNQFCPWTSHGSEMCCLRDGPGSAGGTCQPCATLRPHEEATELWLYDAVKGWFT
jgi:hypothetical protein